MFDVRHKLRPKIITAAGCDWGFHRLSPRALRENVTVSFVRWEIFYSEHLELFCHFLSENVIIKHIFFNGQEAYFSWGGGGVWDLKPRINTVAFLPWDFPILKNKHLQRDARVLSPRRMATDTMCTKGVSFQSLLSRGVTLPLALLRFRVDSGSVAPPVLSRLKRGMKGRPTRLIWDGLWNLV